MENLQKNKIKKIAENCSSVIFYFSDMFHFFPQKCWVSAVLLENNNLITSMVIIATIIMNDKMPDKRQVGLVHENYVSSII
jgi:hypothetical protein